MRKGPIVQIAARCGMKCPILQTALLHNSTYESFSCVMHDVQQLTSVTCNACGANQYPSHAIKPSQHPSTAACCLSPQAWVALILSCCLSCCLILLVHPVAALEEQQGWKLLRWQSPPAVRLQPWHHSHHFGCHSRLPYRPDPPHPCMHTAPQLTKQCQRASSTMHLHMSCCSPK